VSGLRSDALSGTWQATRTGPSLSAGYSRTSNPISKDVFEEDAGTKANRAAKVVSGIGDDAVLTIGRRLLATYR
jgi:hypothetical protein